MAWTYGDSERLDRARRLTVRQQRVSTAGVVLAVVLLLGGGWWLVLSSSPGPPRVIVAWEPKTLGVREFTPAGTSTSNSDREVANLLFRPGRPIALRIASSDVWTVHGLSDSTDVRGTSINWTPGASGAPLKLFCRPVGSGIEKLVAWTWPTYMLRVAGLVPRTASGQSQWTVPAQASKAGWLWCSANVGFELGQGASWDERVVPLLEAAAKAVPRNTDGGEGTTGGPTPRWSLVEGLGAKRVPNDSATYIEFFSAAGSLLDDVKYTTRIARFLAATEPLASIKFIVTGQTGASQSTIRIAFDGNGARAGWVRRNGELQATPLQWWANSGGKAPDIVPPSPPR